MNMTTLESLEINTGSTPDASIIWLHGLGADGHDFAPIVQELELPFPTRFILPHAPSIPVTINGGFVMPAWYDIAANDLTKLQDEAGIRASQSSIELLISREMDRGIRPEKIILAGFSQGGAIALHTGLRHANKLGGIIALSTYLPLQNRVNIEKNVLNLSTPILMAHGTQDNIVSFSSAQNSRALLEAMGYHVDWHTFNMGHTVCLEEIKVIRTFITSALI